MLLFEFFPAFLAVAGGIIAVFLFIANQRAKRDPAHIEPPRAPSQPEVTPEAAAAAEASAKVRRPSMAP